MNFYFWILFWMYFLIPYEMRKEEKRIQQIIETQQPEIVTLTTYKAVLGETDSTPNITASGFKITNPKKHKIIAVSRDLRKKWGWGTKVRIVGAGKYDGTYRVHDLMNKRYRKRIDILIGNKDKQTKLKKIKVYTI
jgi:3D (Asp-Asp-Asp) domain-containing protein